MAVFFIKKNIKVNFFLHDESKISRANLSDIFNTDFKMKHLTRNNEKWLARDRLQRHLLTNLKLTCSAAGVYPD